MHFSRRTGSGFTLIELLIVVAIIAILAAIAVPNFLQAQIRSKVSRARADMRSQLVAIETYHIDNNVYPCDGQTQDCLWSWVTSAHRMTTPIAYMTYIPEDPFVDRYRNASPYYWFVRSNGYGYNFASQTGKDGFGPTGSSPVRPRQEDLFPRRNVGLFSVPRDIYRYGFISPGPDGLWEWDKGNAGLPEYAGDCLYYDATNGTVSHGDLYAYGPGNAYNPPSNWAR